MTEHGSTENADGRAAPLHMGADQPALRPFSLTEVMAETGRTDVVTAVTQGSPFHRIVEFTRADRDPGRRILLVPPLSGHFAILLRDLVLGLLPDFRVAVLDWVNVRHVSTAEGGFGLAENVGAVAHAIGHVGSDAAVLGLCQGGVSALMAAARIGASDAAAMPATLILVAAPIDPMARPTAVARLVRQRPLWWFKAFALQNVPSRFPGHGRVVYPAETQLLALRRYLARHRGLGTEIDAKLAHDDGADPRRFPFLDLYTSLMDLDATQFLENIALVFHDRALASGLAVLSDGLVDLRAVRGCTLVTIEGALDDVAAPGQTAAAHALCPGLPASAKIAHCVPGCGHFSLFHGDICRAEVVPAIRAACDRAGG